MLSDREVDLMVARRIRVRRKSLGITQVELSNALGVTYQQVQKYERAGNRISAGRLWRLSKILGVSIGYFFDDADQQPPSNSENLFQLLLRDPVSECINGLATVTDKDIREFVIPLVARLAQ